MLDLDPNRTGSPPRDAATLVLVRGGKDGLDVFCVERHPKSGFLGGAVVFPGGKLDPADMDPAWETHTTAPRKTPSPVAESPEALRGLLVAACRESLEEAALLPVHGARLADAELLELRARAKDTPLLTLVKERGLVLDLAVMRVFARWITPIAEARRYDTRFVLAVAPHGQSGAHDERETTSSFWARPADVLARFAAGQIQLAPPTHRTLELLAACRSEDEALAFCDAQCLDPVCPRLVSQGETRALTLPGDPEHEVAEVRVPGLSRYVLRGDRWLPEAAPAGVRREAR